MWDGGVALTRLLSGLPYYGQAVAVVFFWNAALFFLQFPQHFFRSHILEKQFGLSEESLAQWFLDELKALFLQALLLFVTALGFYAVVRSVTHGWGIVLALSWLILTLVIQHLLPSIIIPWFYPMKPLGAGPLRERLEKLIARLGIPVREIFEIALSRKTKKANAAVIGFGRSRRVVLGDTLISEFTPEETEVILSHELGHVAAHHTAKSFLFHSALVTGTLILFEEGGPVLARAAGTKGVGDPAFYPVILLGIWVLGILALPLGNAFSRRLEREADAFALRTTRAREAFISAMRKLGEKNLADPNPSRAIELLFYSHPPISRRIESAKS